MYYKDMVNYEDIANVFFFSTKAYKSAQFQGRGRVKSRVGLEQQEIKLAKQKSMETH